MLAAIWLMAHNQSCQFHSFARGQRYLHHILHVDSINNSETLYVFNVSLQLPWI